MLQQSEADDYVIATGVSHSVREFVEVAFGHVGLDWNEYVRTSAPLYRPAEAHFLLGDAAKARATLGWQPKTTFEQLVREMVDADCRALGVAAPDASNRHHY